MEGFLGDAVAFGARSMLVTRTFGLVLIAVALVGCASTPPTAAPAEPAVLRARSGAEIVPLHAAPGWRICTHGCEVVITPKAPVRPAEVAIALPPLTQLVPLTEQHDIDAAGFDSGRATLADPHALGVPLARLRALLADGFRIDAEITGYTDSTGAAALNRRLAQARADTVAHALTVAAGDYAGQLRVRAEGRPQCCYVADNASAAGRAANRRVTIQLRAERAMPAGEGS